MCLFLCLLIVCLALTEEKIFYQRTKVQKDLSDAQEQLAKFDIDW